jgi:hypothetical protein
MWWAYTRGGLYSGRLIVGGLRYMKGGLQSYILSRDPNVSGPSCPYVKIANSFQLSFFCYFVLFITVYKYICLSLVCLPWCEIHGTWIVLRLTMLSITLVTFILSHIRFTISTYFVLFFAIPVLSLVA